VLNRRTTSASPIARLAVHAKTAWHIDTTQRARCAAGGDAAGRYPGVAAHLAACPPCGEDFRGLLDAVTGNV
jgi:anti-sigma factor ChrR (cupin superfamily)